MQTQVRGAFPPHARRRLAEVGAVEVVSGAGHTGVAGRRQRGGICVAREGAGPVVGKAETVNWTNLLINSTYAPQTRRSALRRMAHFLRLFLVFAFTKRRRMASRFHPTPCEMNVKRGSKPTAEPTKNQRKT